ncbi:MAG: hypothetical protein H7831_04240 [Magnetococcus sp. WYHC-3]
MNVTDSPDAPCADACTPPSGSDAVGIEVVPVAREGGGHQVCDEEEQEIGSPVEGEGSGETGDAADAEDMDNDEVPPGDEAAPSTAELRKWLVGVRMPDSGMVYRLVAKLREESLPPGSRVLLETRSGEQEGVIVHAENLNLREGRVGVLYPGPINRVSRVLSDRDLQQRARLREREESARRLCRRLIRDMALPMGFSRVSLNSSGNKATFFFTAENRVDFRELVRTLARELKIRVEMRQVGVRDETRMLGGLGPCGRTLCCAQHLRQFHPVSVRMAKNQELSLNPDSISGVCGRLMCCLAYENDFYLEERKHLPRNGTPATTREGRPVLIKNIHPISHVTDVVYTDDASKGRVSLEELTLVLKSQAEAVRAETAPVMETVPLASPPEVAAPVSAAPKAVAESGDSGGDDAERRARSSRRRRRSGRRGEGAPENGMVADSVVPSPPPKPRGEAPSRRERSGGMTGADAPQRGDRSERSDQGQRGDRSERSDQGQRADRSERSDQGQRGDRPERSDQGQRGDRPERSDQGQRGERPERSDQGQRGERPERGEKPQRTDRGLRSRRRRRSGTRGTGDGGASPVGTAGGGA